MSWHSQATAKGQRPHRNDEHRACPTTPKSINTNTSSSSRQNPVQQNVIESTSLYEGQDQFQPYSDSKHSISSTTIMSPIPSDPEGSIPIEEGLGGLGASSSVEKMSTDNTNLRTTIKHDTTSRSSLPGYRGSLSTPTSSHTSTSETSMLSSSDTTTPDKPILPSDHGGARPKTQPLNPIVVSASQPQQTSSQLGILSSHLQHPSTQYTTSSGGAVLQTLRDPSHYEELSVIGNGK